MPGVADKAGRTLKVLARQGGAGDVVVAALATISFVSWRIAPFQPPHQFLSNCGYSRNTLAAVTRVCFVTLPGGSFSPVEQAKGERQHVVP